jgi:hypothetical protein
MVGVPPLVQRRGRLNRSSPRGRVEWGRSLGLGRDLGKATPGFQRRPSQSTSQVPVLLTLDVWKLNESLALFRSLVGLYAQLEALTCQADADNEPPPSPPGSEPPAIACGVRRLTVPLIPRAPVSGLPGLGMVTRDDYGTVAPTGGARAA